jgi:hypothetical protein
VQQGYRLILIERGRRPTGVRKENDSFGSAHQNQLGMANLVNDAIRYMDPEWLERTLAQDFKEVF